MNAAQRISLATRGLLGVGLYDLLDPQPDAHHKVVVADGCLRRRTPVAVPRVVNRFEAFPFGGGELAWRFRERVRFHPGDLDDRQRLLFDAVKEELGSPTTSSGSPTSTYSLRQSPAVATFSPARDQVVEPIWHLA